MFWKVLIKLFCIMNQAVSDVLKLDLEILQFVAWEAAAILIQTF